MTQSGLSRMRVVSIRCDLRNLTLVINAVDSIKKEVEPDLSLRFRLSPEVRSQTKGGYMKNDPYVVAAFLKAKEAEKWAADGTNPIVTISRQVGALGEEIALRTSE